MGKVKILCVDDERSILANLAQQLREELGNECEIETAGDPLEANEIIQENSNSEIALVISDQIMPKMKGDEFLAQLHQTHPHAKKILLTGQSNMEAIQNAVNKANLYRYLSKPWDKTDLIMTVKEAINLYKKSKKIEENNLLLESIYKNTQILQPVYNTNELINITEQITFQAIDLSFQLFYNIQKQSVVLCRGLITENELHILNWLQNKIPNIQLNKFLIFENNNEIPIKNFKQLIAIELTEKIIWVIGFTKSENNFTQSWLKLFTENLKAQLQKAYLFENMELKIRERTQEVQKQNAIIQEQHQDIMHSIRYAQRIQKAILPKINIKNCPLNFHFLYQPRDIISGDFYWFKNLGDTLLFALGDCTGHGVPGAMLSTLSISILNQLIADFQRKYKEDINFQINEFINQFAQNFSESLNRTYEHHAKDGLEIGLFLFNTQSYELQFAGANMDLWIVRNQKLFEIEGCKQSIEGWNFDFQAFKNNTFQCECNDFIVLFTDGIPDQFGGENNRKFGYKKLREFFIEYLKPENSPNQLDWLNHVLKEWQGNQPQTDDRLCFVFKV